MEMLSSSKGQDGEAFVLEGGEYGDAVVLEGEDRDAAILQGGKLGRLSSSKQGKWVYGIA